MFVGRRPGEQELLLLTGGAGASLWGPDQYTMLHTLLESDNTAATALMPKLSLKIVRVEGERMQVRVVVRSDSSALVDYDARMTYASA